MRKLACIAGTVAAAILVAACAGNSRYWIEPGHEGAEGVAAIALLPLNLVVSLPEELEYPSRRVSNEIRRYLADAGREVVRVRLYEARRLLAEVGGEEAREEEPGRVQDALVKRFVDRLAEEHAFDAMVLPSLVYRDARIRAVTHYVDWDGVRRELTLHKQHGSYMSMRYTADVAGKMPAVSLHLMVYDAAGERIFESYGGLDVVHEAGIHDTANGPMWSMELKRDRLVDEGAIREGVRLAFDPYLPPAPASPVGAQ